ncbi:MAG: GGDEF domain-containing protein [Aquificae bacterium]|nr:GGDEF domain-containing protein [Aquificota bacterium]
MTFEDFFALETLLLAILAGLSLGLAWSRNILKDFILLSVGFLGLTVPKIHIVWTGEILSPWAELMIVAGAVIIGFSLIRLSMWSLKELEEAAFYDPLTGAYNRKFIIEYIHEEFRKSKRLKSEFAILLVDLNDFKHVNDTFGHDAGDRALKIVYRELKSVLREYDLVARWGGDEFLIVLPSGQSSEVMEVVNRLTSDFYVMYKGLKITLSVGYACFPQDGNSLKELIDVADTRMYKSKKLKKEAQENAMDDKSKEKV